MARSGNFFRIYIIRKEVSLPEDPGYLERDRFVGRTIVILDKGFFFTFITMKKKEPNASGKTVYLFTDGACSGNPGPGGYGVILRYGNHEKELSGGFKKTTNNRMELMAVIKGLEALKSDGWNVIITTDSKYVIEAISQRWLFGWEKKGWKKVKNPDLWKRFLELYRKHHITFRWIKGHDGHMENERCDELAVQASHGFNLKEDTGYAKMIEEKKGMFEVD